MLRLFSISWTLEKVVGAAAMVTNRDPRYRLSKEAVESAASQV
jgi:hypothetical protein